MDCTLDVTGKAVVARIDGRVDESTWQDFGTALSGAVAKASEAGAAKLIVDLTKLTYMSSRGLRVLTVAKREAEEAGLAIELASPNEVMREILAISRYDKLFVITDTVEATG